MGLFGTCFSWNFLFIFVYFLLTFDNVHAARKINVTYNPECNVEACSDLNLSVHLIYTRSEGDDDCLHYIISTIGPSFPTVMLLKSQHKESNIKITWDKLLSMPFNSSLVNKAIRLVDSEGNMYNDTPEVAVYMFSKIWGYSDNADTVDIHDPQNVIVSHLSLDQVTWNVSYTNNTAIFKGTLNSTSDVSNQTWLALNFDFYDTTGREPALPRLAFNDRSTKMEFIMNAFAPNYTSPRYALFVHVSNPRNSSAFTPYTNGYVDKSLSRTIDDEYAPSVFTSTQVMWKSHPSRNLQQNFWHWRTVCYTKPNHVRLYSTDVKSLGMETMNHTNSTFMLHENRLLLSYFGHENLQHFKVNSTTVSFGKPDDDFYNATNYLSWTTLVGFGAPPGDSLSLMVICILLAGVVCPFLVIVGSGVFLFVRKWKRRNNQISKSQYQAIQ